MVGFQPVKPQLDECPAVFRFRERHKLVGRAKFLRHIEFPEVCHSHRYDNSNIRMMLCEITKSVEQSLPDRLASLIQCVEKQHQRPIPEHTSHEFAIVEQRFDIFTGVFDQLSERIEDQPLDTQFLVDPAKRHEDGQIGRIERQGGIEVPEILELFTIPVDFQSEFPCESDGEVDCDVSQGRGLAAARLPDQDKLRFLNCFLKLNRPAIGGFDLNLRSGQGRSIHRDARTVRFNHA